MQSIVGNQIVTSFMKYSCNDTNNHKLKNARKLTANHSLTATTIANEGG